MAVIEITSENFEEKVLKAQQPVLVDFWASWCGPCKMLSPIVDKMAEAYADKLTVGKVNVDDQPEIAARFGIMSIPTLILFKDGQKVDVSVGLIPSAKLEAFVQKVL